MAEFDNAELLTDIRGRGSLPSADLRFTDTKLLAAATTELRDVIATLLVESQAERQVYVEDMAVSAGSSTYRLPSRALAGRWQSVGWKGSGDTVWTRLRQLSPSDYYLQGDGQGPPFGFFVRDYNLVLVPTPSRTGTLRLPYYMRPNTLGLLVNLGTQVAEVDAAQNAVTVADAGSFFGASDFCDVIRATPGFETMAVRAPITVVGQVITFDDGLPTGIAVGDYVCIPGQSPVAQCPVELRGLLATRAARRALIAVGEANQAAMLDGAVAELSEVARALLSPRVDDEPREWGDARRGLLYGVVV